MVSSEHPWKSFNKFLNLLTSEGITSLKTPINYYSSSVEYLLGSGSSLVYSYFSSHFFPSKIIIVASPPSSTKMLGPLPSGQTKALKVHSQYSLKFSPFQAKTLEVSALTIAAAA